MCAAEMIKKTRTPNFTSTEEMLLVRLVKNYKDTIECKQTDSNANRKKVEVWEQITKQFNASSGDTYRSGKTLRNKYENLKKRTKYKFSTLTGRQSSVPHGSNKRDLLQSRLAKWSEEKIDMVEVQKQCILEQHQLKMRHMQEAHENDLAIANRESQERIRIMTEEHEWKMETKFQLT